jgi:hypothetical protein
MDKFSTAKLSREAQDERTASEPRGVNPSSQKVSSVTPSPRDSFGALRPLIELTKIGCGNRQQSWHVGYFRLTTTPDPLFPFVIPVRSSLRAISARGT